MSHPFYGDAPPDVIAKFEADRAARIAEENRRKTGRTRWNLVPMSENVGLKNFDF